MVHGICHSPLILWSFDLSICPLYTVLLGGISSREELFDCGLANLMFLELVAVGAHGLRCYQNIA